MSSPGTRVPLFSVCMSAPAPATDCQPMSGHVECHPAPSTVTSARGRSRSTSRRITSSTTWESSIQATPFRPSMIDLAQLLTSHGRRSGSHSWIVNRTEPSCRRKPAGSYRTLVPHRSRRCVPPPTCSSPYPLFGLRATLYEERDCTAFHVRCTRAIDQSARLQAFSASATPSAPRLSLSRRCERSCCSINASTRRKPARA